ncbi:MAG: hypothetical protein RLZZ264_580 [Bacillota bacterium]|jgi:hypothetical protein
MSNNIFDLEQGIMKCWNVVDDLDLIYSRTMEKPLDQDEMANILLGMKELYQMKFEECFNHFEDITKEYFCMRKQLQAIKVKEFVE